MIVQLAKAISYPDQVPERVAVYAFRVDSGECIAEVLGNRLIVKRVLDIPETELPRFAEYAAGRLLREESVLAWDDRTDRALLWRELPTQARPAELLAAFEDFLDSCDWWVQRVNDLQAPPTVFPDILIRP